MTAPSTLTVDKLRAMAERFAAAARAAEAEPAVLEIIVSSTATKPSTRRLFPASRHRSRRIHKKLVKRFGAEFARDPAIFKMAGAIVVHPALADEVIARTRPATRDPLANPFAIPVRRYP